MAELRDQIFQYTGFKPNEICLSITEENRQVFRKIITEQDGMTDIIIDDYQFLQQHGHNEKVLAHIEKRFKEVPLASVLI
ncbi:3185_t:CDS:2 [Funneliformis geosporum]|uniref:3185_t:CDS:1 n=1 Tax=Funneliformis geosporum TaxID=1117311 RepID=A0A9W4T3Z0_9GLOM|nr:3185_t:CDS:2 [Funneliformis geosporum]